MKRRRGQLGLFATCAVLVATFSLVVGALPAQASVQNFYFSSFEADYYLTKDEEGRSALKVEETLVAQFPSYNQNKGIERAIPKKYDGHSVSLVFNDESLMRNGQPEPVYEKRNSNGNLVVGTGTEEYVHGEQTYTFSYTMRDVTKDFGNHQELYWDTNGTQWSQRFYTVKARVHLDAELAKAWLGNTDCYQGAEGSNATCPAVVDRREDGSVVVAFRSTRIPLAAGENVTFNLGFKEGTFAPHVAGLGEILEQYLHYVALLGGVGALVWAISIHAVRGRNHPGRGTIVPQYLPPKDVSIMVANTIYKPGNNKTTAAQLVDFAVRHNIQIVEYDKPQLFGKKKAYKLRLLTTKGLNADEKVFIRLFFPGQNAGDEYDMGDTTKSTTTGRSISVYVLRLLTQVVEQGYRRKFKGKYWPLLAGIASLSLAFYLIVSVGETFSIIVLAVTFVCSSVNSALAIRQWPLTEKGAELRDHVKGLKMYITVAEEERLKVLQSVEGADRQTIGDVHDRAQLVKLYERVLPYAILLGLEKSWGKVLETYADPQSAPSWYVGAGALSMSSFTSSLSSFAASTSSSSSGMGGGGSSGGGGGGGGGGGR